MAHKGKVLQKSKIVNPCSLFSPTSPDPPSSPFRLPLKLTNPKPFLTNKPLYVQRLGFFGVYLWVKIHGYAHFPKIHLSFHIFVATDTYF